MTIRKPVWTEGLFITQHHLQQLDAYHESLLAETMQRSLTFHFGITELEIDTRALANGQIVVRRLSAVLPDATILTIGGESEVELSARDIGAAFPATKSALPVYVGLRHESDLTANVAEGTAARFERRTTRVVDFNDGSHEQEVTWAKPNVRLFLGDESRDGYATLQIAELIRNPSGQAILCDTYIPPVARIATSPFLHSGMRRVLTAMVARQRALSASRRQRDAAQIEFQASDVQKYWLLDALNGWIPIFSHLVDQGQAHPERAYEALVGLVGRLCTFAVDADPASLPKFDFLAMRDAFEPLFARALSLLDAVIKERYVEIPLRRREDGMHLAQVEDASVLRFEFFLAVTGTLSEQDVRDRLPKLSKIASWGQIGGLLNSAVNGARIEVEYRPPGALPIRPGLTFFRLLKTPEYWMDIQGTGTLAIYHPLPSDSLELKLYAVDPQNL
ncbi:MAG: type VI secretion system baseplate subunit TssK [Myxococcales bacterium]|nr:type VI secretion system baseplate subunit TssK [Myxococcales bacterium]